MNQVVSVRIYITLHSKPNKRGDFWAKCVLKRQGRGLLRRDDGTQGSVFGLNKKLFVYLKPFCTHLLQLKAAPRWQHRGHELLLSPSSSFHSSSERFELLLQVPSKDSTVYWHRTRCLPKHHHTGPTQQAPCQGSSVHIAYSPSDAISEGTRRHSQSHP